MLNTTADKHFAPPPRQWGKSSSISRLRSSSRFMFPRAGGDIKLQQRQKQHPDTPLPTGLPSPLSAVSSKCLLPFRPELSTQSVSVCPTTTTLSFQSQKWGFTSHLEIKSWCVFSNLNNRNADDAVDKFHSHILHSHAGLATHDSKQFSVCHCAVTSIISSKSAFWMFVFNCFLPCARWGSCVILPQEQVDSVACLCLKARVCSKVATEACWNQWTN